MALPQVTNIQTTQAVKPRWSFYAAWILLTSICIPVAFFLDLLILRMIIILVGEYIYVNGVRHITEDYLAIFTFIPIVGLLTGTVQYVLLRRVLPRMGWWVFATLAGWLLGVLLTAISVWLHLQSASLNLDFVFLVMGLSIGLCQWFVLRQRLPRASWWIAANVLGWVFLGWITPGNSLNQFALFILGLVPASATAVMLALLMRQTQPAGLHNTK